MTRIMRLMRLHRLLKPADDGGSDAGGAGAGGEAAAGAEAGAAAAGAADLPENTLLGDDDPAGGSDAAGGDKPAGEGGDQADGEKKPEGEEKKAPEGAPEEYAEFVMPEGVKLEGESATEFKAAAKELNLTQAQAQKMADIGAKQAQRAAGQNAELVKQARTEWAAAARADKEFGGEAFNENLAYARKARDTFGTPEFKTLMNGSGIGDHPEMLRFMVRAGKAISADTFVAGGASKAPKSDGEVFYGSTHPVSQPAR